VCYLQFVDKVARDSPTDIAVLKVRDSVLKVGSSVDSFTIE